MNAQLKKVDKVDWSKFTLTEWLYQFGYWQADVQGAIGLKCTQLSPLYNAIKEAKLKLNQDASDSIIASYFCNEDFYLPFASKDKTCLITDDEAMEVQQLVVGIINYATLTGSPALLSWMKSIIKRYFRQLSWSKMKDDDNTEMDAKYDVRCGLAVLHLHYPYIKYVKGTV